MAAPSVLRYAHIGQRLVALAIDFIILAVLFVALVYAVNAVASLWNVRLLDPLWSPAEVLDVRSEPVGTPATVKHEDGVERTTAYSRETRIYADGAVRIFAVIEGRARLADGTETAGRAESLIGESAPAYWRKRATYAAFILLALVYAGLFEASVRRATPGKRALRLTVTDLKGQRLTPGRAILRQVTKLATLAMSGFGYLTAIFTMRQQAMHDLLAGTVVIYARPSRPAAAKP